MREIRTVGDAIEEDAIITATCNNPMCQHSSKLDLWRLVRRFGDRLDIGRMRRMLKCQVCGSGAIIAVLPKDWGNLQDLWREDRKLMEGGMADGTSKADWTVEMTSAGSGVVYRGAYRARFTVSTSGRFQIIWPPAEPAGDVRKMQAAAHDAVADAINRAQ